MVVAFYTLAPSHKQRLSSEYLMSTGVSGVITSRMPVDHAPRPLIARLNRDTQFVYIHQRYSQRYS